MTGLQILQEKSTDDGEDLGDSGYASVDVGDGEGDDAIEEERNDNKGRESSRQNQEKEGAEKQDNVDDEDVSCLLRVFPIAFEVIFWSHHLLRGNYHTKCTESESEYRIGWEFELNAAEIATGRAGRQRTQGGDPLQEGVLGSRREQQLLQLLDDVVGRRPF
ncbi:uncharacterized protein Z519_05515 [Cladophialophora bantiana CBS 173.52]|uniref:Uncharacterized protein n=1 Tax=Cladophialophora bantiana (strain ATCC 10958 / CBS 173.52 / CDC B-1940 / NIH 8579) TaxID=1442370 RepID=A0A0D2IBK4_CLAB1|nr:uncharacterized protein Z519_05515 [Cladophialophora bantiana CBS 173.52]KIW94199.1 hypothetical protein Z519_05515 [Cladophialophora bantiana CBS 173.52]